MPRDATKRRTRERGFEVCNHTCKTACRNMKSRSILWVKEGNSCSRHARREGLHPDCKAPCPAAAGHFVRTADASEYGAAIQSMLDAHCSDTVIDAFFSKYLENWKEGRDNWPLIPSDRDMEMDAEQPHAGSSFQPHMDVDLPERRSTHADADRTSVQDYINPCPDPKKSEQHRTIKLLYIPDPSRAHGKREEAAYDLGWVKRNLTQGQLAAIKDLKGSHFKAKPRRKDRPTAGGSAYRLTEWLWVTLCLSEHRTKDKQKTFDVSFMSWGDFKDVLVDPQGNNLNKTRWEFIQSHDVIIGGMDYTIDTNSKESAYGLHGDDRERYDATLAVLMQVVKFWPPVPSLQMAARKWNTVAILDMIAAKNGWKRPKTTVLTPGCAILPGTVLKRSHSECGECVIMPERAVEGTDPLSVKERSRLNALRSWSALSARTFSEDQRWASQEYVETLISLGEWRCFILGGHVSSIVHTHKTKDGIWSGRRVTTVRSFREIRELWQNRHTVPVTYDVLVNPETGDGQDRSEGWEELKGFIDKVYRGMDIGLLFDEEGNPAYFVNEIERTQTMSMWLKIVEDTSNRSVFDRFARILHGHVTWLDDWYTC